MAIAGNGQKSAMDSTVLLNTTMSVPHASCESVIAVGRFEEGSKADNEREDIYHHANEGV